MYFDAFGTLVIFDNTTSYCFKVGAKMAHRSLSVFDEKLVPEPEKRLVLVLGELLVRVLDWDQRL